MSVKVTWRNHIMSGIALGTITDLVATAGVESAVLAWTPAANATSHQPQYKLTSSGTWLDFGSALGGSATGVTVTGLTAASPYDFRVIASDGSTTTTSNVDEATPTEAPSGATWRGNEPGGMTVLFDEAIADWGTIPLSADAPIPGSDVDITGNNTGITYSKVTNQDPPRGAPAAVEILVPDGLSSGVGGTSVYLNMGGASRVYFCQYHKIPTDYEENSVSSKFLRFVYSGGDILVQLNRFENYFEVMNFGTARTNTNPIARGDIITGGWVLVEVLLDRGTGRIDTWLDGEPILVNGSITTGAGMQNIWIDSTWGGSTAAKDGDSRRYFSDFYVSEAA